VLQSYFAPILLTQQSPNDRVSLLPCGMTGNMIGDSEKNKRVQLNMQA
jgi:hypothetical protein